MMLFASWFSILISWREVFSLGSNCKKPRASVVTVKTVPGLAVGFWGKLPCASATQTCKSGRYVTVISSTLPQYLIAFHANRVTSSSQDAIQTMLESKDREQLASDNALFQLETEMRDLEKQVSTNGTKVKITVDSFSTSESGVNHSSDDSMAQYTYVAKTVFK